MTSTGQNTGISNMEKNVKAKLITIALNDVYQNLNSGKRRINGRNSSVDRVGKRGTCSPSSSSNSRNYGSCFGVKKRIN